MPERAAISRHYHIRILVIGLLCVLVGLWFLRDGYSKYPKMQQHYQRFTELKEQYPGDYQQRWYELARAEHLPEKPLPKTDADIFTQKLIGYLLIPFGVLVLLRFLLNLRRWIEMDEAGIRDQSSPHIPWSAIRELDKSRWERKGIAVVRYEVDGKPGRIVLDDWKFDRDPIVHMVERIDAALGNTSDDESADHTEAAASSQPDPV